MPRFYLNCIVLFLLSFFIFSISAKGALPEIPEDPQKAQMWEIRRLSTIAEIQKNPEKSIPGLAEMLRQLKVLGYRECSERDNVVNAIELAILTTPNHAKFFTSRLEQAKEEMQANKISYHEYTKAQENLSVLAFLPSPETVAELGKLLNDPVGRDGKILGGGDVWEGDGWLPVNCQIALSCLEILPIENGPQLLKGDVDVEVFIGVDKWKDWWEEVKTGKRTYRFVGSPVEYGPDGPVPAKELQRRERQREATSGNSIASKQADAEKPIEGSKIKLTAIFASVVAGILLMIAGWKVYRRLGIVR